MRKALRLVIATAIVAASDVAATWAQERRQVDPVVVTATKIPEPRSQVGATVTVITEDEIRTYDYESVGEALRRVPGVEIRRSGSLGATTDIRIRGTNPNQVQVLIDGIRVKSPTLGQAELADIALDQIERIEVVRGPQSTIHGADAIGGVVNIITKRGQGPPSAYASVEAGNYDTFRTRSGLSGSTGPFDYSLGLSWTESNGQFPNDRTEQRSLVGRFGLALPADGHISISTRYNRNAKGLPFNGLLTPRPTSPFFVLDPDAESDSETITIGLEWTQKPVDWFEWRARYGQYWNTNGFRNPATPGDTAAGNLDELFGDQHAQIHVERREAEIVTAFRPWKWNTLTLGVEHRAEFGENVSVTAGVRQRFIGELETLSFLIQDELRLFERLIVSGGWRHDHNDVFGNATTRRAGVVVPIPETSSRLRATWAEGFRAPTIDDLFFPDTTGGACPPFGSLSVKPERSTSWDAGIDQAFWQQRVRASVTYFNNRFTDLITPISVSPTPAGLAAGLVTGDCLQQGNIGRARSEGVESGVAFEPVDWLLLDVNHTFTDTEDETTHKPLPRFARFRWNAGLTITPVPRLSLFAQAEVVSSHFEREGLPRNPGYYRLDVGGRYRISDKRGPFPAIEAFARVNNVTDQRYFEAFGFRSLGINALVGLEARY